MADGATEAGLLSSTWACSAAPEDMVGKQGERGCEKRGGMAAARRHHIVWEKPSRAAEISERRDGIENWALTSRLRSDERSDPAGGLPAIYLI